MGGGQIGLSTSGGAANLRMLNWSRKMINILKKSNLTLEELMIYVDDVRLFIKALIMGTVFCATCSSFWYSRTQEQLDSESGETSTARTARLLKEMFNSVEEDLKFTIETAEEFNSGKLPTLDTQLWVETISDEAGEQDQGEPGADAAEGESQQETAEYQVVKYLFYSKPMGTEYTLREDSGADYNSKKASLSQSVVTRLMNTSEQLSQEMKDRVINDFGDKLRNSGYSNRQIHEIIESGIVGYMRRKERLGGIVHRQPRDTKKERAYAKLMGKRNWFRKKKQQNPQKNIKQINYKKK